MEKHDLYNVLIKPVITEKANGVAEKFNHVVFKVMPQASKSQIKRAFEHIFDAKVSKVTVVNMQGKRKRFGNHSGKRSGFKKAYICLADGQSFDLATNQK